MATMIGTNIAADENDVYNLIQGVLNALDKGLQNHEKDKYKQMIENLGKYVGEGGSLAYAVIPQKFTKEMEERLQAAKIDYMLLPIENGMGIAVKDCDKEKFYEIQQQILEVSTEYNKEVTNPQLFLDYINSNPKYRKEDIPTIQCSSKFARQLFQNNLYLAGITPCYDEKKDVLYVIPDKIVDKGGDLVDAIYLTGIDLARCELMPDYKILKQDQITYDRQVLNDFIKQAKTGKYVSMDDCYGTSNTSIYTDKSGNIMINENGKEKQLMSNEELETLDNTTIYATLSKAAGDINNKIIINNEDVKAIINTPAIDENEMDARDDLLKNSYKIDKIRPRGQGDINLSIMHKEGDKIEKVMKSIIAQVNADVIGDKFGNKSPETLRKMKVKAITEILQNGGNTTLDAYLKEESKYIDKKDGTITKFSLKDKRLLLNEIIKSTDDLLGNSNDEIKYKNIKRSELEANIQNMLNPDYEKDTLEQENV